MKTIQQNRESGFTLLELLLVIGVAALLLIGGIATYRLVSDGNKATETARLLLTVRQEAAQMAQQQGGYYDGIVFATGTSSTTSPLVVSGVLRNLQRNTYGGTIAIEPVPAATEASATAASGNTFLRIVMTDISKSSCLKLGQAISNPNELAYINVVGNATPFPAFPPTVAQLSAACVGNVNSIVWIFP